MDGIYLPFLTDDASLKQVVGQMQTLDSRAAVVSHTFEDVRLYWNRALLEAWSHGVEMAWQLERFKSERVAVLDGWNVRTGRSETLYQAMEQALDEKNVGYGLMVWPHKVPGVVLLFTRHEGYTADLLAAKKMCLCEPNGDVVETERDVNDPCDKCFFGKYVVCA